MRVSIRQPLHPFIQAKAQELGIEDAGEVVNYLLLQLIEGRQPSIGNVNSSAPNKVSEDYDDLSGLLTC